MNFQQATVEVYIEIDEKIYECMQNFLASHPQWDRKMLIEASMSLFLMQNYHGIKPDNFRACSQTYLNYVCNSDRYFRN